jgi:hypothetical protein
MHFGSDRLDGRSVRLFRLNSAHRISPAHDILAALGRDDV